MSNFDNDLHRDLFALFILESNSINFLFLECAELPGTEDYVWKMVNRYYQFQYNDRTIHEERKEYGGYVYRARNYPVEGKVDLDVVGENIPCRLGNIRFYFVDEGG
jgi:hypothetical protein